MTVSLVTGIGGQDGTYLAELLLAQGHRVVGAVRDPAHTRSLLPAALAGRVELVPCDLRDQPGMVELLRAHRPAYVFNLAALATGAGMHDDPVLMGDINGLAVARLLEAVRQVDPGIRFCQASSSEMFGIASETPQSEQTAFRPRSPYGAAKLFAHVLVDSYRSRHGLFACSAILFNHESPRRGLGFVTRKISHGAASIKLGKARELRLGNLDARRDWGFAADHVRAMWLMLEHPVPDDYVVATGESRSVREFCAEAFARLDMDYREFVREAPGDYRPVEPVALVGNAARAREKLGWRAETGFAELVRIMVDADMALLQDAP